LSGVEITQAFASTFFVEVLPFLVEQEMLYASSESFPICKEVIHQEKDGNRIYKYRVAFQDTGAIVLPLL
jgi:hypothetical protein